MYFTQCNVQRCSLPVLLGLVDYVICWSVILSPQYQHPVFLQLQLLLKHQHSLPNKGWPVRSSDLWTWSVYNILALSSLANVIITKFLLSVIVAQYFIQGSSVPPASGGSWCPCNTSAGRQVETVLLLSALIQMEIFWTWNKQNVAQFTFSLICRCNFLQN